MTDWKSLMDANPEPSLLDAIAFAEQPVRIYHEGGDLYRVQRDADDPTTVYVMPADRPGHVEVWHDHANNGSGCNNWQIEVDGDSFDLEFCRSFQRTAEGEGK
jgi:hypothetical protein